MIDIILKALWLQSTKWEDLKPVLSHNIHITDNILSKTQGTKNKYIEKHQMETAATCITWKFS